MKKNTEQFMNLAKEWFDIGSEDLKFAESAFRELDAFYPQICFQCQQAVEKYLKGFLVLSGKSFPKIHDLVELTQLCGEINLEFQRFIDGANLLSQYYIITRYPVQYPQVDKEQAEEAIRVSGEIVAFIETLVKNNP